MDCPAIVETGADLVTNTSATAEILVTADAVLLAIYGSVVVELAVAVLFKVPSAEAGTNPLIKMVDVFPGAISPRDSEPLHAFQIPPFKEY